MGLVQWTQRATYGLPSHSLRLHKPIDRVFDTSRIKKNNSKENGVVSIH